MFWAMDCNGLFTTVVPDKTDAFLSGTESTVFDTSKAFRAWYSSNMESQPNSAFAALSEVVGFSQRTISA